MKKLSAGQISNKSSGLCNLGVLSLKMDPIKRVFLGKSGECLRTDQNESFFSNNVIPLLNVLFNDFPSNGKEQKNDEKSC